MQSARGRLTARRVRMGGVLAGLIALGIFGYNINPASLRTDASAIATEGGPTLPADSDGIAVYRAAKAAKGRKILVSTEDKWLWLVHGKDTLVSAPVAIGIGKTFEYNGKSWRFETPRGKRTVRLKQANPIWTVPEWHYYEKAAQRGLEAVHLKADEPFLLEDGTWLEIREDQVGRVNQFGNWWPFSQDFEIIFDGKIFIPPMNTTQRRVTNALGPYKLDTGNGYLIHGTHTYNEESIGSAASHGCIRMRNSDLQVLYELVRPGTPVFIF